MNIDNYSNFVILEDPTIRSLEIKRIYYKFIIENSCSIKIELKLSMFIPKEVSFYIYPFEDYLSGLEANFDGKSIPIHSSKS